METYKLIKNQMTRDVNQVQRLSDNAFIPFDPANTDYQTFKAEVLNGAELQDADGKPVTSLQTVAFIATLP